MRCNDIQLFLIDYLDDELDDGTREQIESHLLTCEKCSSEVKELQMLQQNIAADEMAEPSPMLRKNFLKMLREEDGAFDKAGTIKQLPGKKVISIQLSSLLWRAAAAVIILFVGIVIGNKMKFEGGQTDGIAKQATDKQDEKQAHLVNMLDDESPSQRIEAVNYAEGFPANDQKVIKVLLNTLNTDKNANVRVAAVYALEKFSGEKSVLDSLVTSLPKQTEPVVQILLIDMLTAKRATKAIKPMQDIISNSKTIQPVRDAAQKGLKQM